MFAAVRYVAESLELVWQLVSVVCQTDCRAVVTVAQLQTFQSSELNAELYPEKQGEKEQQPETEEEKASRRDAAWVERVDEGIAKRIERARAELSEEAVRARAERVEQAVEVVLEQEQQFVQEMTGTST